MGELSLSVESLFGLHSRIMQLTYLKTHLTASPFFVISLNRNCWTKITLPLFLSDHLNKTFGDVKAVNDLSFRVKKGELFAFLGVNGAGKSKRSQFSADSYQRTAERYRLKESITKERANRQSG